VAEHRRVLALDDKFVYWVNRGINDGIGMTVHKTGK
jgi:hypothetical protein